MNPSPRLDSILFQLTEDQQSMIYQSIRERGYLETVKTLALPEPEGLNFKIFPNSLRRFYKRYTLNLKMEDFSEGQETSLPADAPVRLTPATTASVHHAAFDLAHDPVTLESFHELSRWLNKQQSNELKAGYLKIAERNADLAEKRLALEREKAEMNAARLALKHQMALQQILGNDTLDDEDKIRAARRIIFGEAANLQS